MHKIITFMHRIVTIRCLYTLPDGYTGTLYNNGVKHRRPVDAFEQ